MDKKEVLFYKEKIPYLKELGINFILDTKSGVPFYRQIIQLIEFNISVGKLKPGDKLPTIRQLAIDLKINPNTIAKAYNELEIRGLVITQVGSGTFISYKKIDVSEIELKKKADEICGKFLQEISSLGIDKNEAINILKNFKEDE
ncbi:MAG: GntR family transcriptional regulator [Spirochaetes bacterium GWD1_27_9]|nr:MAG: GntR family transcriptional regulator [Spirochaetes bacterium GWC1_27_15]OHD32127.1 MAG: GntR family transcriptional regulator [Spirochaetes bacterium GWD1_27_9]